MLEITNLILLILVDILDINQLWKEKIDRRVLHHLQNCRYNYKKIPYIKVFKKLLKVEKKEKLILENREFNFDSLEGNGINTYNKHISGLTGGLYSKKSSVYYKDFSESDKKRLFEIGNILKSKIENKIDKRLYWGQSDFKIVLLRYEGQHASFAWHYDTEPLNCYRTLTLIKANGEIPPFCYINDKHEIEKLDLDLGDTIFFKGTQTYHKVDEIKDANTIRWMLGFQYCDSEYDVDSKSLCSELRGESLKGIIITFFPNIFPVIGLLQLFNYQQLFIDYRIYALLNIILLYYNLIKKNIDIKTYCIFYIYTLVYLSPISSLGYINYLLITE